MIEKIKANIDKITLVLSIVAGALLVPSIIERIGSNMSEYYIILLIEYGLLLVSNLMFVIMNKNKDKALLPALILFFSALSLINVYNVIEGSFYNVATSVLYVGIVVVYLVSLNNNKVKNALYLLMLIALAFFLASALGGGAISLSILLTGLVLFGNIYLDKGEN